MKAKRNQKRKKQIAGCEEDRISRLPDSLLHQILSSIPIKSAVHTCILSKRWRHVWTSLPNLHFKGKDFAELDCFDTEMRIFTNFVNQVLSLRDASNLSCFSLVSGFVGPSFVEKCICYAVRHKVQNLRLHVRNCYETFEFPLCFINCESIKALKLVQFYNCLPTDKPLRLPSLKTLHLKHFSDSNFISKTVGNCPNLETLVLDELGLFPSSGHHLKSFSITAPQLRKLKLSFGGHTLSYWYEAKIVISAPKLTSFWLDGNISPLCSMGSLPCLEDVYIDLEQRPFFLDDGKERLPINVMNMLGQLQEAKTVTLSSSTLEVLAKGPASLKSLPSPFHKLKDLKLLWGRHSSKVVTYLTGGSSSGGTLAVESGFSGGRDFLRWQRLVDAFGKKT